MAALRQSETLSELSGDVVSCIFSLAFSFQQLHRNLGDLANRVNELSPVTSSHSYKNDAPVGAEQTSI